MEQQTSTPWEVSPRGGFSILGQGGYAVASTRGAIIVPAGECLANAQFIVRAVNSHVYLLEACQAVLKSMGWEDTILRCSSRRVDLTTMRTLRRAIAKATGGDDEIHIDTVENC